MYNVIKFLKFTLTIITEVFFSCYFFGGGEQKTNFFIKTFFHGWKYIFSLTVIFYLFVRPFVLVVMLWPIDQEDLGSISGSALGLFYGE